MINWILGVAAKMTSPAYQNRLVGWNCVGSSRVRQVVKRAQLTIAVICQSSHSASNTILVNWLWSNLTTPSSRSPLPNFPDPSQAAERHFASYWCRTVRVRLQLALILPTLKDTGTHPWAQETFKKYVYILQYKTKHHLHAYSELTTHYLYLL